MRRETDFSEDERRAVYRAIFERRDVRNYRPDPVPDALLARMLEAAHRAPSVGFMQPWSFVLLRDVTLRQRIYAHFAEVNRRAAEVFQDDRKQKYQALKLQGILDAPLNLLVTCDPTRGGTHVLGRFTMPETDVYSTCLAIQNLWLAARAEGVGVGWMSIMEPGVVREILGVPPHVLPVAYLTLGYPVEFAKAPMLSEVGWARRLPLEGLVFEDGWNRPARAFPQAGVVTEPESPRPSDRVMPPLRTQLAPPAEAIRRNADLTKPVGSLGVLEQLALQLAALQATAQPRADAAHLTLFAADHGVTCEGVSAYKRETTVKMVYSYLAGGAVVNAFARQNDVRVHVVDVGVDHDFGAAEGLLQLKVARGTRNLRREPAMTREECERAIEAGRSVVRGLPELHVLALGEMGIGNSTSAAALTAGLLSMSPEAVTGRGTGIDDAGLAVKQAVIADALALHDTSCPSALLRGVGGFELAAMVGAIEAAAERRALVLLDGFITGAAALVAVRRDPTLVQHLVASHRSAEPAHGAVLAALGLRPLLELDMRLGEGSAAVLAMGLVRAACAVMREVRTFEEANIERPERG